MVPPVADSTRTYSARRCAPGDSRANKKPAQSPSRGNFGKGATANIAWSDGVRDIILGRRPMSDYDGITQTWVTTAGDQIRKEFMEAMKAG